MEDHEKRKLIYATLTTVADACRDRAKMAFDGDIEQIARTVEECMHELADCLDVVKSDV